MSHQCEFCKKSFIKESSLLVHVCEPKRRFREQHEVGVQLGLRAYLRFYEISQGSAKLKTFNDFAESPYYKAFVKFGRHCQAIRAINVAQFIDWLIKENKKIDHWCKEAIYLEYLGRQLRQENIRDALNRAYEQAQTWQDETAYPAKDYLRHANANAICFAITTGRISPWVLYNSDSGKEFLARINQDQLGIIWNWIDADFWGKKFNDYPADTEYAINELKNQGW